MHHYTNLGEQGNTPALAHLDRLVDRRARQMSRQSGITYDHALAVVLANIIIKGATND
jgi:cell division protein ZapA (FtsZ GTPase activity inhibitor)